VLAGVTDEIREGLVQSHRVRLRPWRRRAGQQATVEQGTQFRAHAFGHFDRIHGEDPVLTHIGEVEVRRGHLVEQHLHAVHRAQR